MNLLMLWNEAAASDHHRSRTMDASPRAITPLRQRMIDDMRMCKLSEKTQLQYIRAVRRLAAFLGRSPDTVAVEDLRRYQLHLVDHGTSPVSINAAITGLKFFFDVTLDRRELITKMRPVRVPRKLPRRPPTSTSECRCTRYGTASPPTFWSRRSTSVSFRCCLGTRSWRPPLFIPR